MSKEIFQCFIFIFLCLFALEDANGQLKPNNIPIRKEIMRLANRFSEREGVRWFSKRKYQFRSMPKLRLKMDILIAQNDNLLERLQKEATDSELIALTFHRKAIVRYESFYEILERNRTDWKTIFLAHLNDNAIIRFEREGKMKVVDAYFDAICGHYGNPYKQFEQETLNDLKLDSAILYHNGCKSYLVNLVLFRIGNKPIHYQRVRELARSGNWAAAVTVLATYRKQEDIPIILSYLTSKKVIDLGYAFQAVKEFPDTVFWKELEKWHGDYLHNPRSLIRETSYSNKNITDEPNISTSLLEAISQYKTRAAKDLFRKQLAVFDLKDKRAIKKQEYPDYGYLIHELVRTLEEHSSLYFEEIYKEMHKRVEMLESRRKN